MAEIADDRLAILEKGYALLDKLTSNPATKREFERVVKKIAPEIRTTDDMALEYTEPLMGRLEKIEKMLSTRAERDQDAELNGQFDEVRKTRNLTDEGLEKLKKFMVDTKTPDPFVAADAFLARQPKDPIMPNGMGPSGWHFGEETEDNKGMLDDPEAYFDKVAAKVWNEERARTVR